MRGNHLPSSDISFISNGHPARVCGEHFEMMNKALVKHVIPYVNTNSFTTDKAMKKIRIILLEFWTKQTSRAAQGLLLLSAPAPPPEFLHTSSACFPFSWVLCLRFSLPFSVLPHFPPKSIHAPLSQSTTPFTIFPIAVNDATIHTLPNEKPRYCFYFFYFLFFNPLTITFSPFHPISHQILTLHLPNTAWIS